MSDNTADSFDQASEVEQTFRDAAVAAARQAEPVPKDFDGESCYDCGLEIPLARLNLGKFRCVPCQEVIEKSRKMKGNHYA